MPIGLVVMRWDDRVGTELIAKYPEEIAITDKTLMQVYSTHEYSAESGMISLMVGSLNIASFYTGADSSFYILLLLSLDDDPDAYEGGLADASRIILQHYEDGSFNTMIPSIFQRLSVYPSLNEEQRLAMTYQDETKRMVINRLRDEGVVTKSEMMVWLKDKYKQGFVDLDSMLIDLIKREIIKEASVKGMPSELIFLTNDLLILRRPPIMLLRNPEEKGLPPRIVSDYLNTVKKFFQNYQPTDKDNLIITDAISDPQVYETLRLLKMAIVTKNELEKLKKKGVENIDEVLKILWQNQIIQVFQDKRGIEHYALITDLHVSLMFPKYLLNIIKAEYENKSKSEKVLIEYLSVLEDAYLEYKAKTKRNKIEINS